MALLSVKKLLSNSLFKKEGEIRGQKTGGEVLALPQLTIVKLSLYFFREYAMILVREGRWACD